ncbi:hypothetical protein ACFL0W_03740 [Nanoarchaeota archaeon]
MEETNILKIGLITSIIGISFLFLFSTTILPEETTLAELKYFEDKSDQRILIKGRLDAITQTNTSQFLKIKQQNSIDILAINPTVIPEKGAKIEVIGTPTKPDINHDTPIIMAEEIRLIG